MNSSSSTSSSHPTTTAAAAAAKSTIDNFDYGTRYEQLLIDQRKLESIANDYLDKYSFPPLSNHNESSSSNSSGSGNNIRCSTIAASLSANRVALLGMLQSAIHTSSSSSSKKSSSSNHQNDESVDGLICLWEHTLNEQRFGNDFYRIHNIMNKKNKNNNNDKKNQSNVINPCLHLWTLDAIERSHEQNNKQRGEQRLHHSNDDNNNNIDDEEEYDEEELEAQVNDFFAMNPEYQTYNKVEVYHIPSSQKESHFSNSAHDNNEYKSSSLSSSSSSLPKKQKENNHQNRNNMKSMISSSTKVLTNPYQTNQHQSNNNTNNNSNQQQPTSYSSWDVYNAKHAQQHSSSTGNIITMTNTTKNHNPYSNNRQGNESMYNQNNSNIMNYQGPYPPQQQQQPNQKKNPFCTAKELKQNDTIHIDDEYDNNSNNNNNRSNEFQYNNNNNPYQHQQQYQQQLVHNPNRPALSAGLKRKFQTPKLGGQNTSNNGNNSNNAGNQSTSRLPSQQIVNNNANGNASMKKNNNNNNNDDNNDDDLPEALKGLDKELIAKIENEIVDSGDPITFKDIAGLDDAKQTVMELVCWPMKRPDLFTGLRRGPNGLLLFGPPGKMVHMTT